MYRLISIIIIFGFFLALISCRQKEDISFPEINILAPKESYAANLPDTFELKVEVFDDRIIRSVALTVVNEDKTPVIPFKYYYPDRPDFTIQTSLVLEDKSLPSGLYQLMVIASDGTNTKYKYREIKVNEIPQRLLGYIAFTAPLSFKTAVIRLNTAFETDNQLVIHKAHLRSAALGLWEQFFFISGEPSVLSAYNARSFEVEWEMHAMPPRPVITSVFPDKELVFSTANGDAGIISEYGPVILRTAAYADKSLTCIAADEGYIYAGHRSLSGFINYLTVYYRKSGAILQQEPLSAEIMGLVPLAGKLLVFVKVLNDITIIGYDPDKLTETDIATISNESFRSVEKISDKQVLLLTDRCVILYDYQDNRFDDFTAGPYDFGRYDRINNVVFLARDNSVYVFQAGSGNLTGEISFADKVVDFHILYNK